MTEKLVPIDEKGICGPSVYLLRNWNFLRQDVAEQIVEMIEENYYNLTKIRLEDRVSVCRAKSVEEVLKTKFFTSMMVRVDEDLVEQNRSVYCSANA